MASFAQFYSSNLATEVKKGMRQKVLNGGWPHRPPRGYVLAKRSDGIGNDVGYPSTVQLDDDTLVTALYFARGSAASEPADGWCETSCQALRYPEALVTR